MLKLRAGIVTTMLQLTSSSLDDFDDGEILRILDTQVQMATQSVWLHAFGLPRAYAKLVVRLELVGSRKRVLLRLFYRSLEADEQLACFVGRSASCRPLLRGHRKSWLVVQDIISVYTASNKVAYDAKY